MNEVEKTKARSEMEEMLREVSSPEWKIDSWEGQSLVSVEQLTPESTSKVLEVSYEIENMERWQRYHILAGYHMLTMFEEASTRTYCSTGLAGQQLGALVMGIPNGGEASSFKKGETIADTIRALQEMELDLIGMRHSHDLSTYLAAKYARIPVLNLGSGKFEHPTQALLDLRTIYKETGIEIGMEDLSQLDIAFIGDPKHGRTIHSLAKLLAMMGMKNMYFVSPDELKMPQNLITQLKEQGVNVVETTRMEDVVRDVRIIYMTRIQKERFSNPALYDELAGRYKIDRSVMDEARLDMILMHPLPRVDEISPDVDEDPRAAYFRQVNNGLYTRMSTLTLMLKGNSWMNRR